MTNTTEDFEMVEDLSLRVKLKISDCDAKYLLSLPRESRDAVVLDHLTNHSFISEKYRNFIAEGTFNLYWQVNFGQNFAKLNVEVSPNLNFHLKSSI